MLRALLYPQTPQARTQLAVAIGLSAVANTCVMAIIQYGVEASEEHSFRLLCMLWLACVLYLLSLEQCTRILVTLLEDALCQLRVRLAQKISQAELLPIEQLGPAQLQSRLGQATRLLSTSAGSIALAVASAAALLFLCAYVAYLSRLALLLIVVFYGGGGAMFYLRRRKIRSSMRQAAEQQLALFGVLNDLLRGSKELRLHHGRATALSQKIDGMATALQAAPLLTNQLMGQNFVFARLFMFGLLGTVVFVLPHIVPTQRLLLGTLLPTLILMFDPLARILRALPEYERAEIDLASLQAMEARLDRAMHIQTAASDPWASRFTELRVRDLSFRYPDGGHHSGFAVGPLSFGIRAAEITFLTGGNGAGKTTLLKLITTLYSAESGTLTLDGTPITPENRTAYRELFAGVFAEPHLFSKLYGLAEISDQQVTARLEQMQIADRIACVDGQFSQLALSSGQSKRLAMAVALLEDRPFLVFDEWAADQDPEFRRYFYEDLLPDLRRQGKAVLVISHDDRYFHIADQILKLEDGQVTETFRSPPPDSPQPAPAPADPATSNE